MSERKLLNAKHVDLFSVPKNKPARLKVSWLTYQGAKKKRGNPTMQYVLAP